MHVAGRAIREQIGTVLHRFDNIDALGLVEAKTREARDGATDCGLIADIVSAALQSRAVAADTTGGDRH